MHSESKTLPKLIVLLGPTTCGKTEWSLRLAKKINGEIISADSRQIYKNMSIGTAKILGVWEWNGLRRTYVVDGIFHHLIDFLNPGKTFTVAEFRDRTIKHVKLIIKNKRIPIIAGGTGMYISSVVDNWHIPQIGANKKLRQSLEEKSCEELTDLLGKMDQDIIKTIDQKNKRRLIRALEVCIMSGEPFSKQRKKGEPIFSILQIGIDTDKELLDARINDRIDNMIQNGLVDEISKLLKQKYSWNLPSMSGIGYKQFKGYFKNEYGLEKAIELLKRDTRHLARKQLTWFRRDQRIKWCKTYDEAEKMVDEFLAK
ncbi:MAG: tRNA (adenosine(37)-N6)-dimethylallyltransferase MiaA [Candidatus Magasanikbacteria bacterium CG_4_10_14_0_2_um_filter_37_12]|uniref:tRNA dimethylallyltransferase n=1 Tax=Candidatus Magasanikbacteria bacterium CG_4_10_14_0_2_um_filter_37_12 TaxID=1974637 RepID=A0A2M7V758_9BACT|nr:MAG: tRNA (adenosine(37)-N6)-dimethylallyltransferase MiaA [Candidatus Magasanikbacteria bacterium CG_4_10_14_0_2_um_filter_37_12]